MPNRDPVGRVIAEWVMNSAARLGVKYVIWWVALWGCGGEGGGIKVLMGYWGVGDRKSGM